MRSNSNGESQRARSDARALANRGRRNTFQFAVCIGFVIGLGIFQIFSILFVKEAHDVLAAEQAVMSYLSGIDITSQTSTTSSTATSPCTTPAVSGSSAGISGSSMTTGNNGNVPRLAVISKPNPMPEFSEVKKWMAAGDGGGDDLKNQTAGQFMIDFAVLGFAKCGTSTMMKWLGNQPEVYVPGYEITDLTQGKPTWDVIAKLYGENDIEAKAKSLAKDVRVRGYKSPNDIMQTRPINVLREYFPETKIIVGLRHPVFMLESFYNHRIQNGLQMPALQKIPYTNQGFSQLVTLGRAAYSDSLIHLGKTPFQEVPERSLIHYVKRNDMKRNNIQAYPYTPNKVYLYDTAQLNDENTTRRSQLLVDIQNFLGLNQPLDEPLHFSPGKEQADEKQKMIDEKKIKICEDQYKDVRNELIKIGKHSQEWILNWFLKSPDVYVSNRQHFIEILKGYQEDPC